MLIRTFKEYLTLVNFYCNFILKSNLETGSGVRVTTEKYSSIFQIKLKLKHTRLKIFRPCTQFVQFFLTVFAYFLPVQMPANIDIKLKYYERRFFG